MGPTNGPSATQAQLIQAVNIASLRLARASAVIGGARC